MIINLPPGVQNDRPRVGPDPFIALGFNIRSRLGRVETVGLVAPLFTVGDATITVGAGTHTIKNISKDVSATILTANDDSVTLIEYDPASTPTSGPRWRTKDITPAAFGSGGGVPPSPGTGVIPILEQVDFAVQDDVVVILRKNTLTEDVFIWDRDPSNIAAPLANAPRGAVAACVLYRILILLGAQSFADPDPSRFLTVRWSAQNNFEDWTPTDTNISGELQVNGSRIVGGGSTRFGIAVFTDDTLTILDYTGDFTSVFTPNEVAGATGLLANETWCEANGVLWYFDSGRNLMAYDGGAPRVVANPCKQATIDVLEDDQLALASLTANPEYSEIILNYATPGNTQPNRQLVYNYVSDSWSQWTFQRGAWTRRVGVMPLLAVDESGAVFRHDLDVAPSDAFTGVPGYTNAAFDPLGYSSVSAADVVPYDFAFFTNAISMPEITQLTYRTTRGHLDHLERRPADATDCCTLTMHAVAYGEARIEGADTKVDSFTMTDGVQSGDLRVAGKAVQVGIYGNSIRTHYTFGAITLTDSNDEGPR